MAPNTLTRRLSAAVGGAAILAMIGFSAACGTDGDTPEQAPVTSTEPTLTPTEKSINTDEEDFTPPVKAPQQTVRAPNAPVFHD
ncbi:hypothetical protein [Mycolicibacterium confluentis]|uniref:Uncharacterized protein n=1 Tax=Mycolicibacterium confluentis TaxID=28047 RepID=A0A7I7Y644_9MYCO|nr:hypothetical protein [Mycolicibacterium confluentis]MCV7319286.1 hypothetical protein [Mycolicibacterium confluentis]ORV25774.1 hypothetical protein AWB99_21930 [Mycolicibacterium confluentis]BBZ36502.1 hypothetical protein MCNF_51070 [Mycolicibacterium confluentis]